MTVAPAASHAPEQSGDWLARPARLAATFVLFATVAFNAGLSAVNASVMPMSGGTVTIVQGLLMAAAFALGLRAPPSERLAWLAVLWAMAVWWLLLGLLRQAPNPKYLGDIGVLPVFALLGATLRRRDLVPLLLLTQAFVLAVGLWEAVFPPSYGGFFNVQNYYVNTRGVAEGEFYAGEGLYLNAERPVGRLFLPQLDLHRVSSIFLEPVSLGNWTVVVTILLVTLWADLRVWQRTALIGANVVLLVLCDGRFAFVGSVAVLAVAAAAPLLPRFLAMAAPLLVFVSLFAARGLGAIQGGDDTFSGRLAKSVTYFERLSFEQLAGLAPDAPGYTFDSGWTYLVITQSLLGFCAFWVLLCVMLPARQVRARRFLFMMLTFFALNMPVSNSFVSIKAAAFLFALYGCLRAWENRSNERVGSADSPIWKFGSGRSPLPAPRPVAMRQGV
jgi:putative polymerase